jgi:2-keto-4-pentenoate hydratase/2-oxohepta-3-ene-1,7-dioic acid hydratase in catechol pathway
MKIIAVGWNYALHNKELSHNLPSREPVIFMKPDTALLRDNASFYLPDFSDDVQYETEVVFHICKIGKNIAEKFAYRYYDSVGLGIDFTARDLQRKFKQESAPWELCKAFDGSAPVSRFIPKEEFSDLNSLSFSLHRDDKILQEGNTRDMIFKIDAIIAYVSRFITLKTGDLIFTGTPVGVGTVKLGDRLEGYLEGKKMLDFYIC